MKKTDMRGSVMELHGIRSCFAIVSVSLAMAAGMNACTMDDVHDPGLCGLSMSDDQFGTFVCQCAPAVSGVRELPRLAHCRTFVPNSTPTGCTANHVCEFVCDDGYQLNASGSACDPVVSCETEFICRGKDLYRCSDDQLIENCTQECDAASGKCIGSVPEQKDCTQGDVRCSEDGSNLLTCREGEWKADACGEGKKCQNKECVSWCENDSFQCVDKEQQKCVDHRWVTQTTCANICKSGQCIDCADDGSCVYLELSAQAMTLFSGRTASFNVAYIADNKPKLAMVLTVTSSNRSCISVDENKVTTGEFATIQIRAENVTKECTAQVVISDDQEIADAVTVNVTVFPNVDNNHNNMIDYYDLGSASECRKNDECASGFCDSFVGYRCSNRCTSDDECISDDYFCRSDGRCASRTFETVWKIEQNETIQFPIKTETPCEFEIDWGDGAKDNISNCKNSKPAHTYSEGGEYHIKITGVLDEWGLHDKFGDNEKLAKKLISVVSFGPVGLKPFAFAQASNLVSVSNIDIPDSTKLKSMQAMFWANEKFNYNIGRWDVSNVTDMSTAFYGCTVFNQDIGRWDTSKVTSMAEAFVAASAFNQDIGQWDVSNVTIMEGMFESAIKFNQDIGGWNISKVTDMSGMFSGASAFNQDIGGWNTSKVTKMGSTFSGASAFNQNIGKWDVSNVTEMQRMFLNAESFNADIGGWNTSKVTKMNEMFENTTFNHNIGKWNVSNVTDMQSMFYKAKMFNQNIAAWDTSKVEKMDYMFSGAEKFNQDLSQWHVTASTSRMFIKSALSRVNYCKIKNSKTWSDSAKNCGFTSEGEAVVCNAPQPSD
ncbi:MAG: BspA family leucine-rich repeat surface protein [Proteobacteria bacterium]|nr:BspA family leucine-rich repeat surface protein [Pseudomonadota bacterium]